MRGTYIRDISSDLRPDISRLEEERAVSSDHPDISNHLEPEA